MAWPDNLSTISTNLKPEEFTVVKFAIEHELVEWDLDEGGLMMDLRSYSFRFLGKEYIIEEIREEVTSLNRKVN